MQVRMTYQYKLYNNKQNSHLDRAIDIAAEIWNHCIALHRRYYRMYGKHLSANRQFTGKTRARKYGLALYKFACVTRGVACSGSEYHLIDNGFGENEGDLICAAEFATTENVNFMASYAKGLICMPMSKELTRKLKLNQMVTDNTDNHCTAFTVSIDHVDTSTGISAVERSITAMKLVEDDAKPEDFRRPGSLNLF